MTAYQWMVNNTFLELPTSKAGTPLLARRPQSQDRSRRRIGMTYAVKLFAGPMELKDNDFIETAHALSGLHTFPDRDTAFRCRSPKMLGPRLQRRCARIARCACCTSADRATEESVPAAACTPFRITTGSSSSSMPTTRSGCQRGGPHTCPDHRLFPAATSSMSAASPS